MLKSVAASFTKTVSVVTAAVLLFSVSVTSAAAEPITLDEAVTTPPVSLLTKGITVGAYAPTSPYDGGLTSLETLEYSLGTKLKVVNWYKKWGEATGQFSYGQYGTLGQLEAVSDSGRIPTITWEPWSELGDSTDMTYSPDTIIAGTHDAYIQSWADGLKTYGLPIYLRPMHEMNGQWYPWSAVNNNGNTPVEYVAAWKHIVDIFDAAGATNVKWVWSVNNIDYPASNTMEQYWPGSSYVDVMGIDAYNCGQTLGWKTFEELVKPAYDRLAVLDATLPIWVNETGTCEPNANVANSAGKTKGGWLMDIFNITSMPRLDSIVFFNEPQAHDWRLTTSTSAAAGIRTALSQMAGWTAPPAGTVYGSALAAPTNFTLDRKSTYTDLVWTATPNASGYVIYRDNVAIATTLATTWKDVSLNTATTHNYKIAAIKGGTRGTFTATLSAVPASIFLSAKASADTINLTWESLSGTSYEIYRNDTPIGTVTATGNTSAFSDTGLPANTSYVYQVKETLDTNAYSDMLSIRSAPATPTLSKSASQYVTQTKLSWYGLPGAALYKIYRDGNLVGSTSSAGTDIYTDKGLAAGIKYIYQVEAVNTEGGVSAKSNSVPIVTAPSAPTAPLAENVQGGIKISWTPVTSATSYLIYKNGSSTPLKQIYAPNATYTDSQVISGTSYSYTVRAVSNSDGATRYSLLSPSTSLMASGVPSPTNLTAKASGKNVTLSWTATYAATSYTIFRDNLQIGTSTLPTYTNLSVTPNTTYTYHIIAHTSTETSAPSSTITIKSAPAAPVIHWNSQRYMTKIVLDIDPVAGAALYKIYKDNKYYKSVTQPGLAAFTDTGLTPASFYQYTVYAVNSQGSISTVSNKLSIWTSPAAPTGVTATYNASTGVTLNWNAVDRASSYRVYIGTSSSAGKYASATTYIDSTAKLLSPGTTRSYWVQAVRDVGTTKLFSTKTLVTIQIP